jgi:hypothetical protein
MLALSAWAGDGVLVQRLPSGLPLTGQVEMLADPDGTLTLDAVRAAGPERWARPADDIRLPGGESVHWLRIPLQAPDPGDTWLLAMGTTALNDVTLYGPFDADGRALAAPAAPGCVPPTTPARWPASAPSSTSCCRQRALTSRTCGCRRPGRRSPPPVCGTRWITWSGGRPSGCSTA